MKAENILSSLPLELINKIITVNPHHILGTYFCMIRQLESPYELEQEHAGIVTRSQKRKRVSTSRAADFNLEKCGYYLHQSSWFRYFISSSTASPLEIDCTLAVVIEYFQLLETHYKQSIQSQAAVSLVINEATRNSSIIKLESILADGGFNNALVEKQFANLVTYYNLYGILEIPAFVRLVLILNNVGYFQNVGRIMQVKIHGFLEMILADPASVESREFVSGNVTGNGGYRYYEARYQFIPLFTIYLGMGYSLAVGWDYGIDNLVGILENGSSGHEVMANISYAMRYFMQPVRHRMLNKKNRKGIISEILEMLRQEDISILEGQAWKLNFANSDNIY